MLYEVKKFELIYYFKYVLKLLIQFDVFSIKHTSRKENCQANALANLASTLVVLYEGIKVSIYQRMVISSSIEIKNEDEDEVNVVSVYEIDGDDWR